MIEGLSQTVEVPAYALLALYAYRGEGKELYETAKTKVSNRGNAVATSTTQGKN